MKSSIEVAVIGVVAVAASLGTWMAGGSPSGMPEKELAAAPLRPGEVRLATLVEGGLDGILWVDARKESAWKSDGLEGSIHLTILSDEPLMAQVERHLDALADAGRVVVYCDDLHCSLSHDLAGGLREIGIVPGEILVLQGGMTALRQGGLVKGSSPGS